VMNLVPSQSDSSGVMLCLFSKVFLKILKFFIFFKLIFILYFLNYFDVLMLNNF
jgi:hypothetical protein